jgi:uncharacterized protein (TIGR03032 family)
LNVATPPAASPQLELLPSRQFLEWLAEQNVSLAFTTYQAGKLFLIGRQPDQRLSVFERSFSRCMGMWCDGQTMWLSSLYQLWRLENILADGVANGGYDRVFVPQAAYTTADIDIHDLHVDDAGRPVFVNTLFSCLATSSETKSFRPLWRPPFISRLAAEDRCHLNGLAMRSGQAAYVTAASESDVADGWRDWRRDGGVVLDVAANEIVGRGYSMPHSPRWYRDTLYLHDSGTGRFGTLDPGTGSFTEIAFCPGYLRGLTFVGDFAVVGLSQPRENRTFSGLALDDELQKRKAQPICALMVIDLRSGSAVHWLRIEGIVTELYDIAVLPGVRRPQAIGLKSDEIRRVITIDA